MGDKIDNMQYHKIVIDFNRGRFDKKVRDLSKEGWESLGKESVCSTTLCGDYYCLEMIKEKGRDNEQERLDVRKEGT